MINCLKKLKWFELKIFLYIKNLSKFKLLGHISCVNNYLS